MEYYAIVHNDFDGTASAAVYARAARTLPKKVFFTEPTKIGDLLNNLNLGDVKKIMIADIGMNQDTLPKVLTALQKFKEVKVEWFDHHVWKENWKEEVKKAGVELYHDVSTCGAGVVNKYMNPDDDFSKKIASADCSVDIWLHNDPLGEKLRRIVEYNRDYSWKEHLIALFYSGKLWEDDFNEILEEMVNKELKGYNKLKKYFKVITIDNEKVAFAIRWKGPPDISYAAQYIMSRTGASVFVSANGVAVSFRSNSFNVRKFAVGLGGGGHPLAAGASLKLPLLYRIYRKLGMTGPVISYVMKKISPIIEENGFERI
ncbi:phosphoesterase [Sulfolobales archaeon HS-7]|nr:phosphoesterase [Sulfolobales archaeon HS-7]